MGAIAMLVVASNPHPAVETRYYVSYKNGVVLAYTASQFLKATRGEAYTTEQHECLAKVTEWGGFELFDLRMTAVDHHRRAVLTDGGLPRPELRCPKCARWHDTLCAAPEEYECFEWYAGVLSYGAVGKLIAVKRWNDFRTAQFPGVPPDGERSGFRRCVRVEPGTATGYRYVMEDGQVWNQTTGDVLVVKNS